VVSEDAENIGYSHSFRADEMGIAAATIKSKSKLAQPPKRFSYLYNVVIRALFPKEHAHSFGPTIRTLRACLRQIGSLLNGANEAAPRRRVHRRHQGCPHRLST